MTIKEIAKEYRDEIMDGIAWVAIYKTGRSWNAMPFYLDCDTEKIEAEDMDAAKGILKMDENAIFINEYYCGHMGDGTLADIAKGILFHYENGYNRLKDSVALETEETAVLADFMASSAGEELKETIRSWDRVLKEADNEERGWKSAVCAAEWNGFKEVLKYISGIEFFFSRTDEYFGICTEDEAIWLFKEER